MVEHHDERACFQEISEQEARERLGKEFEARLGESRKREETLKSFEAELARGGDLGERFEKDPTGLLQERGILQPLDQLELQLDIPGELRIPDFEIHIIRCFWVCYWQWRWVCVIIRGRIYCYRRLVLHCRRICIWG